MPVTAALGLFVTLIIVLSLERSRLVYELSGMSLLLFGSTRPGVTLYSLIFLPGTIIHELSHWIVAEILQVRTGEITIFPSLQDEGDTKRLGSVATEKSDPFRGFLIGVAPFISGILILVILARLLSDGFDHFIWWQLALIIYGIVVTGNSMMVSKEDRRTWPIIIFFILFIFLVLSRIQLSLPTSFWNLTSSVLSTLNMILGVTAGINLVMIGGSYGLRRLIEQITKRRIVHK